MATYFIDSINGNNNNNGLSIDAPLKDLSKFKYNSSYSSPILKYGDTIKIKKNSVLYGSQYLWAGGITANNPYITITSYGTGEKPKLSLARIINNSLAYNQVDANIWSYDMTDLTYSDGYKNTDNYAFNIGYLYDDRTESLYGNRVYSLNDLSKKGDFYVNNNMLYMYFDANPFNYITKIIGNNTNDCLMIPINNMIIDGIIFTECSSHGIKTVNTDGNKNIIIRNCDFINIGGGLYQNNVRFGNGVEIYQTASNIEVYNNNFINIYDTATTCQGNNSIYENIMFYNNYIERCSNSFELWCEPSLTTEVGFKNVKFNNNINYKNGYGFGGDSKINTCVFLLENRNINFNDVEIKNNVISYFRWFLFNNINDFNKFINNKLIGNKNNYILKNEDYTLNDVEDVEMLYPNMINTKTSCINENNTIEDISTLVISNLEFIKNIANINNSNDEENKEKSINNWIVSNGTLNTRINVKIGNLYILYGRFTPNTNINAYTTMLQNNDPRIRPKNTNSRCTPSSTGTDFIIYSGGLGTNNSAYLQSSSNLISGTGYEMFIVYECEQ